MKNNNRQLNIELLRIFSMLLINLWHVQIHFWKELPPPLPATTDLMVYVTYFIPFHVDLFILITGYFGVRNCKSALLKNTLLIYFYSIGLGIVSWIASGQCNYQDALLPISSKTWWFMTMYTVMLLIAPVIEKYVKDCSRLAIYGIAAAALFVNLYLGHFRHVGGIYDEGLGMTNFISMYLLGVWIRKEGISLVRRLQWPRTFLMVCILCAMAAQYKAIAWVSWSGLASYSGVYCIVMSMLVFLLFATTTIPEVFRKPIMFFSSSAISVYLVTEYPAILEILTSQFVAVFSSCGGASVEIAMILGYTVIAFVVPCLVDKLRIPLTNYVNARVTRALNLK